MNTEERLLKIIKKYRKKLHKKIEERKEEMQDDNTDHYMVYNALGFTDDQGFQIDYLQNVGRFLYKYAGSMMEELVIECFKAANSNAKPKVKLDNTIDSSPKTVEIDCLVGKKAYEIKWKDATTDGDHIKKEHKRVKIIKDAGYKPVRIMFFEPNRTQAVSVQEKLNKLYKEMRGEYYAGQDAWKYVKKKTGIDLERLIKNSRV